MEKVCPVLEGKKSGRPSGDASRSWVWLMFAYRSVDLAMTEFKSPIWPSHSSSHSREKETHISLLHPQPYRGGPEVLLGSKGKKKARRRKEHRQGKCWTRSRRRLRRDKKPMEEKSGKKRKEWFCEASGQGCPLPLINAPASGEWRSVVGCRPSIGALSLTLSTKPLPSKQQPK